MFKAMSFYNSLWQHNGLLYMSGLPKPKVGVLVEFGYPNIYAFSVDGAPLGQPLIVRHALATRCS